MHDTPEETTPAVEAMNQALNVLRASREKWVSTGVGERISILDRLTHDILAGSERWVSVCLDATGSARGTPGEADEWFKLAVLFRALRLLRHALTGIQRQGRPALPAPLRTRPDGRVVAPVFPQTWLDRLTQPGVTGEVWMEPGMTAKEVIARQARIYTDRDHAGKVALVLGAGNVSMLQVMDSLHKLLLEDQVVILKMNPVNAYLGPILEETLRALIEPGFLRIVQGGPEEGATLCRHPAVDEIHMTGSAQTFEAIVFGTGEEGRQRRAERKPQITKRITAELGNITPVIIVPGPWSDRDIRERAEHLAYCSASNAGFNCATPRVLVQHKAWAQREALIAALGSVLSRVATRTAYYPGAEERYDTFLAEHPGALRFGEPGPGHLPWTLITDVDPDNRADICFRTEAFCSVCAETALEAQSVPEYIDRAVDFCNEVLWGTLAVTIVIHPASVADPDVRAALDRAIAGLRYGSVCVNVGTESAFYTGLMPWGGFPGHDIYDVQSGIGGTCNSLMFDTAQKSVLRAPFLKPMGPVRITSGRLHEIARKAALFEVSPSAWKMPGILWSVLRG